MGTGEVPNFTCDGAYSSEFSFDSTGCRLGIASEDENVDFNLRVGVFDGFKVSKVGLGSAGATGAY